MVGIQRELLLEKKGEVLLVSNSLETWRSVKTLNIALAVLPRQFKGMVACYEVKHYK